MTGYPVLDWAILSVSLFNTSVLLWIGLTVLLNADRRNWGVWMTSGGLLAGALFFISHTAILGQELALNPDGLNFWWQVGWLPVIVAPFTWYVAILWYGGFWTQRHSSLRRRHRLWFHLLSAATTLLVLSVLITRPIPTYEQIVQLDLSSTLMFGSVPLLLLVFPVLIILCIALSIDVLRYPGPAERVISESARLRSRPWLLTTAGMLLLVSLLVTAFIGFVVFSAAEGRLDSISLLSIGLFDLFLSLMIGFASTLLGQAIVCYEVFTGKVLPRRSLWRHWRSLLLIALAYSLVIGGSLTLQLRPIYSLLLTTLVMVVFYALYTWRSFVDREQSMRRLRPFVSSPQLMTHLLNPESDSTTHAADLFRVVCQDVLSTRQAQLIPSPGLATLIGQGLVYPAGLAPANTQPPHALNTDLMALVPEQHSGFQWAIPLWAARGMIGTLLIGEKQDGGLYAQEEIDIAQASGERIVDMLASEQVVQRLMEIERVRWREHQVMDLHTRRTLHDHILPVLHSLVLKLSPLSSTDPNLQNAIASLSNVHKQISSLIHTARSAANPPGRGTDLAAALQRIVNAEFAGEFEAIAWHLAEIPPMDALMYDVVLGAVREVIRNAAVHGRGEQPNRTLHLKVTLRCSDALQIAVEDDGIGIAFTTLGPLGSGGGLTLHNTLLAVMSGALRIESGAEGGTRVTISVPRPVVQDQSSTD